MHRIRPAPLAALAAISLSCGFLPQRGLDRAELPAVSAAPAAVARAVEPGTSAVGESDRDVAALVREFEARHTGLSKDEIRSLARVILEEAERHDIDLGLVLALMHVESRYYNFAVSRVGALGLMQIMPATGEESARELGIPWNGPYTLFDPEVNVRIGVWYLVNLRERYGKIDVALAAYNWGPHRIDWRLRNGHELPKLYPSQVREAYEDRAADRV